jgi:hypothetical protein
MTPLLKITEILGDIPRKYKVDWEEDILKNLKA